MKLFMEECNYEACRILTPCGRITVAPHDDHFDTKLLHMARRRKLLKLEGEKEHVFYE